MDDHPLRRRTPSPFAGETGQGQASTSSSSSPGVTFAPSPVPSAISPATPDKKRKKKQPVEPPLINIDSDEESSVEPRSGRVEDDQDDYFSQDGEMRPTTSYGALESTAADDARRSGAAPTNERFPVSPSPFRSAILPARRPQPNAEDMQSNAASRVESNSSKRRQMSFKRRAPSTTSADHHGRKSLLHRSIDTFTGRSRASSDARGGGGASGMRRIPTMGSQYANTEGGKPRIPSIMPSTQPLPHSTPIPTVPFVVLCLVCFGEFSSSGVAGPFLFFLIESFNVGGEAEVGFWAGIAASAFFFAQFLTSLLWASAAEKHGRRAVLLVSLAGNAISLVLFGMSTNLKMALSVRLAQGLFNGAVGVAKGAVRDLTDETNEGRAMGQLGFAWGMGGIVGPLLGGLLCNPVDKFPWLFKDNELLTTYPYLLPCGVVASFTALGAFLSLFIGPDGGPRTGAIQLPEKTDVERTATNMGSFGRSAGKRISGYFTGQDAGQSEAGESSLSLRRTAVAGAAASSSDAHKGIPRTFTQQVDDETGGPPSPHESDNEDLDEAEMDSAWTRATLDPFVSRTTARQNGVLGGGSAYGYEGRSSVGGAGSETATAHARRNTRSASGGAGNVNMRPGMRNSMMTENPYAPDFEDVGQQAQQRTQRLSFAQRFLLANDDAVLNLSDLWVAAAINNDEAIDDDYDDFGYDYEDDGQEDEALDDDSEEQETLEDEDESIMTGSNVEQGFGYGEPLEEDAPLLTAPRHLPPLNFAQRKRRADSAGQSSNRSRPGWMRRNSGGRVPSLYANTGVENANHLMATSPTQPSPLGMAAAAADGGGAGPSSSPFRDQVRTGGAYDPTLAGIPESSSAKNTWNAETLRRAQSQSHLRNPSPLRPPSVASSDATTVQRRSALPAAAALNNEKAPTTSLFSQLPLVFISHYGLMGFHSSTFDQVFMAFLVTPFKSGGLGLTAAHYAELIAAMAFCQIIFQFYL